MSTEVLHLIIVGLVIVGVFITFVRDWASPDMIAMSGFRGGGGYRDSGSAGHVESVQ